MYVNQCKRFGYTLLCAAAMGAAWPTTGVAEGRTQTLIGTPAPSTKSKDIGKDDTGSDNGTALLSWVNRTGDNLNLPFMLINKTSATTTVFDRHGGLLGKAPILIGLAIGDDSAPGIGNKPMRDILPGERTTPAGRFPSTIGHNLAGVEILWIDYELAVSMHPLVTTHPAERRAQRLASPTPTDNRISYGCVNVSGTFFRQVVVPAFKAHGGMVYVLPEVRSMTETFGAHWPDAPPAEPTHGQ